ncbi:helix-turn-helix domain-containing protein [Microbacterium hibisci]|uniref:helix-turn-helix domain-containing protein n=1 Tax=Microbacterium hibisci TaxID=2036000 RepID=UPI0019457D58|nr:helix-turn-helix transcriptional regulator [Microbacterium hibisci]
MTVSDSAFGQVVRDLRREQGLTQGALGVAAGYQGGAGVTVSRIENGLLEPSADRLEGIATALGLTSRDLLDLATARAASAREQSQNGIESFDHRIAVIQEVNERRKSLATAYRAYTEAGAAADSSFLSPFRAMAARIEGIEVEEAPHAEDGRGGDCNARAEASYQLRLTTYGVKEALARSSRIGSAAGTSFDSFAEAVALSTVAAGAAAASASMTSAMSGLGTALNVASSLRGARSTSWLAVAGGVVAGALVAALTASGAKRTRKQRQILDEELLKVEEQIADTQPGLDALLEVLPTATKTLNYIAVHAGHALDRWDVVGASGHGDWRNLGDLGRSQYEAFAEIAAAQVAVQTISVRDLVESRGQELDRTKSLVDEVLTQSWERVTQQV